MSRITKLLSLIVVACLTTVTEAQIKSGLQVGDFVDEFEVKDCSSGLSKGETLCYR